ncbi:MAG: AAA family ATPase [Candidatus Woesebacteria bacterium]
MSNTYSNVTISGLPGGGSTTLLKALREHLEFDGWRGFSGGEFMRAYALEKGIFKEDGGLHHSAADYEDEFDRKIDYGMREKLESEEKWIIESWLSGFLGQGVKGVLKVLVHCSDDAVRVDRIVNRDQVTAHQALENMRQRKTANVTKWVRMYEKEWKEWVVERGLATPSEKINFWKPELYDLVIDTYSTNQDQTLHTVLEALGKR